MRVLLIKTSSMGDLIHTLPALTDAKRAIPNIKFDWVVEDVFADIPRWHPAVDQVIPVALRRWRKGVFAKETRAAWRRLRKQISENHYDLILDAQGLVKSAFLLLTCGGSGVRAGLDWGSAREPLASLVYQRKYTVNFYQHAIVRMRSLFSLALSYDLPTGLPDYGLMREKLGMEKANQSIKPYLVFLVGTTWESKQWPETYWNQLAILAEQAGYHIKMSGNNAEELAKAARIAGNLSSVEVLPRLSIAEMAVLFNQAKGAVAVDTGLGHLAAALNLPTVSIYGSTNPEYTGALGSSSIHLSAEFPCSPCLNRTCAYEQKSLVTPACYQTVPPEKVMRALMQLIRSSSA